MSPRGAGRASGDRLVRSEPFELFRRPQRSLPARIVGLLIRLRAELTAALVAASAWVWLIQRMPSWTAALVLGVPAVGLGLWAPGRRWVTRRSFAVMTRHRLRAVLVECRVMNYSGNMPILLWSRPTAVGERVWMLLRAGIDVRELELRLSHISVGCWASDARVSPHSWTTALVVLDVVRRDPLAGPAVPSRFAQRARKAPVLQVVPALGGGQHV
jgi:hypothetical protein